MVEGLSNKLISGKKRQVLINIMDIVRVIRLLKLKHEKNRFNNL
jgi:hypothetical protein